jgi:hypothetical protein
MRHSRKERVMRRTALVAPVVGLVLIGLGLVSCIETPLAPREASYGMDAPTANLSLYAGVVQSVSGNAHLMGEGSDATVTFVIRKHADGSVDGWYNASRRGKAGADIKVRMECLHVVDNQAWAGGTIVEAVNPDNVGRPVSYRFIDNGEGVNAPPDEFGGIWEENDCATEPDLDTRPVTIGNLKVRG